jgi:RecA-family ATPase
MIDINTASEDELDALARRQDRKFILFRELAATSSKEWLVHNFLGAGEASAMYGKPGDGKSVLAEDLALHVAAGRPWHGRPVKRGAVLYVALERRKLVERRAIAFRSTHGIEDLPFAITGGVIDFRDTKGTAAYIAELCDQLDQETAEPVVLIVIDTLSRALCGGDENSPKDMGAIINTMGAIQERTRAHPLWVHHMPQDGERMRGHGALLGALDTTIHVEKTGELRTARVVKSNDSEEGEQVAFTLESVTIGQDGDTETTAPIVVPADVTAKPVAVGPKLTKNQQTMFSILHGAGSSGLSTEQWNEGARQAGLGGTRKADLYDFRAALKSKGVVHQYGDRWTIS